MPGLDLTKAAVLPAAAQKRAISSIDDVLKEVDLIIEKHGLHPWERPEIAPRSLAELRVEDLTSSEIEHLFAQYQTYAGYISTELARVSAAYKISSANLKKVEAGIKNQLFAAKTPKQEIVARVQEHPVYVAQANDHLRIFATKEILESHYGAWSKQAAVLSRVIELRKLELEQLARSGNLNKRPNPAIAGTFKRPSADGRSR